MKEWTILNIVIEVSLDQKIRVNKYSQIIDAVGTISTEHGMLIIIPHKSY